MKRDINGMIVVITGASAGIGRALAQELSGRGAKLVLAARRIEKLDELNQSLGGKHFVAGCDVSNREDCENLIAKSIEHFGRIDTLVANAGVGDYRRGWEIPPDALRAMFSTNVFGTTDLIHAIVPILLKQQDRDGKRGQIMIVSSAAARRGVPYLGAYCATKAAQLSISEALRVELRPHRVAVTSVHPIMTATEFGSVAEAASGVTLPRGMGKSQTVEYVAKKMARAIERPRPEVWPHQPTRLSLVMAALFPRLADKVLSKYRRDVENANK